MTPRAWGTVGLVLGAVISAGGSTTAIEATAPPIAVVELFTSEGCSSCPPADRLLADLARDARRTGTQVFALEYHVDYWNHLGWTDPYSSAAFSRRQREYGDALGLDGVYTPQMIVNGVLEFVGSDRARTGAAVEAALAKPARVRITATCAPSATGTRVDYRVWNAPQGVDIHAAWVEDGIVSRVRAGENSGRTLAHAAVVREHVVRPVAGRDGGTLELRLRPAAALPSSREIVVFVQDPRSMAILGATRASVLAPRPATGASTAGAP